MHNSSIVIASAGIYFGGFGNLRCVLLSVVDACAGPCLAPAAALAARLWTPMFVGQEALESVLNSATSVQSTSS